MKIVAFDPALSNLGIALLDLDTETMQFALEKLVLVQTEASSHKTVRKSSDDLDRARQLYLGMVEGCKGRVLAIAEIPTGTQSARGAMGNGIALGVIASCPIPLIQVNPTEVKMASVGIRTASKGEMIAWAMKKYPSPDWLMRMSKGKSVPMNDNEHLADALAVAEAGIRTDQFKQALAFSRQT